MSLHNCHIPVSVPVPGKCLNKWHCFLLYFNSFCPFFLVISPHLASSHLILLHPASSSPISSPHPNPIFASSLSHPRLILASSLPHPRLIPSSLSPSSAHINHPSFPHPPHPLIPFTLSLIQLLIHSHFAWFYLVHPVFNTIDHLYLSLIFPSSPLPWV